MGFESRGKVGHSFGFNIGFVNLAKTLPFDIDLDVQGQASALTCRIGIRPPQSAIGQMREWYVAAELNGIWYAHNGTGWGMVGANGFPVYKTLELGPSQVVNILSQQDVRALAAAKIYVGYGVSWSQMLDEQNYRLAYQIPDR